MSSATSPPGYKIGYARPPGGAQPARPVPAGATDTNRPTNSAVQPAAKLAMDFDSSMLKIRALVGESEAQVADWREGVLKMSSTACSCLQ